MADLTGEVKKVEDLLPTCHSKKRTTLVEEKTLDNQKRNVLSYLRTFRTKDARVSRTSG